MTTAIPSATSWRAPPPPLAVLQACEWLSPAEAVDPGLQWQSTRSSHALWRVRTPQGRCAVIKQVPQQAAAQQRSLRTEMLVYRLAAWMPGLAQAVPKALFIDEARQVLVVQALSCRPQWPDASPVWPISRPDVAAQLGRLLAGVHRATAGLAITASPAAGVLGLPEGWAHAAAGRPITTQALMQHVAQCPVLSALLQRIAADYRPQCLIHGDLRPENWLRDEAQNGLVFKLIDWELAGQGDPAWDLGALLAQAWIDHTTSHPEPAPGQPCWQALATPVRALLQAYGSAQGLVPLAQPEAMAHLVRCAAARLLHVACEHADQGASMQDPLLMQWLACARHLAHHTQDEAAHLMPSARTP